MSPLSWSSHGFPTLKVRDSRTVDPVRRPRHDIPLPWLTDAFERRPGHRSLGFPKAAAGRDLIFGVPKTGARIPKMRTTCYTDFLIWECDVIQWYSYVYLFLDLFCFVKPSLVLPAFATGASFSVWLPPVHEHPILLQFSVALTSAKQLRVLDKKSMIDVFSLYQYHPVPFGKSIFFVPELNVWDGLLLKQFAIIWFWCVMCFIAESSRSSLPSAFSCGVMLLVALSAARPSVNLPSGRGKTGIARRASGIVGGLDALKKEQEEDEAWQPVKWVKSSGKNPTFLRAGFQRWFHRCDRGNFGFIKLLDLTIFVSFCCSICSCRNRGVGLNHIEPSNIGVWITVWFHHGCLKIVRWLWINTYRYSLLGDEHPFATYLDVHQGYMVLTHSQIPPMFFFTRNNGKNMAHPLRCTVRGFQTNPHRPDHQTLGNG